MIDAARAADMSDPERNRWFRRRWVDAIPNACPGSWHTSPSPQQGLETRDDFDLLGRELLAAWRRERAAMEGRSNA